MVQRSLKAPLSLNEELTLRRIALGIAAVKELPERSISRLHGMGLIDDANRLTTTGRQRYEDLRRQETQRESRDRKLVSFLAAVQRRANGPDRR
jgi:hypothetical protein